MPVAPGRECRRKDIRPAIFQRESGRRRTNKGGFTVIVSMNKYLAELLGTFVLVAVGSMSILSSDGNLLFIGFGFGLALLGAIYVFGDRSGAHFNPAVTLAMMLRRDTSPSDLVGYLIAQVAGAVLAAGLIFYAAGLWAVENTITRVGPDLDMVQAVIVEAVLTAIFVMVILRTTARHQKAAPLAISLVLVAVHLAAIPVTGASVNPARSLGPAIVAGDFTDIWVYIVGPGIGAVVGFYFDKFVNTDPLPAAEATADAGAPEGD